MSKTGAETFREAAATLRSSVPKALELAASLETMAEAFEERRRADPGPAPPVDELLSVLGELDSCIRTEAIPALARTATLARRCASAARRPEAPN